MSATVPRRDPILAERNLRALVKFGAPHQVPVYGDDIVAILGELDALRAAAASVLDFADPASPQSLRVERAKGASRG